MELVKDYSVVKFILKGDVLSIPDFFMAQGAKDWGYFVDGGKVLPFYIKKRLMFTYMLFTTNVWGVDSELEQLEFLNNVISYIKQKVKVDFILSQHVTALFGAYPNGANFCHFGSYILDLSPTIDDLWAKMHVKHRNVVRKALKENVVTSCDLANKECCIELIQNTLRRQNVAIINPFIINQLDNIRNVDYWIAEYEGNIEGAAIILWATNSSAYYMYGGSSPSPHTGAMNLLQWEVIRKMKDNGVKKYDFVGARISPLKGSKYDGIQRFKERFGGELNNGFLWKMPLNKFKYYLYVFAVWLVTKGDYKGDIIDQERGRGN